MADMVKGKHLYSTEPPLRYSIWIIHIKWQQNTGHESGFEHGNETSFHGWAMKCLFVSIFEKDSHVWKKIDRISIHVCRLCINIQSWQQCRFHTVYHKVYNLSGPWEGGKWYRPFSKTTLSYHYDSRNFSQPGWSNIFMYLQITKK